MYLYPSMISVLLGWDGLGLVSYCLVEYARILRPLVYWDCGFESRLGHGCLSLVSVVCCQVEVSATSWSLVQRSPTDCGVSKVCVIMKPRRNEEAQAHIGLSSHRKQKTKFNSKRFINISLTSEALLS
jgi:hypothetical protein